MSKVISLDVLVENTARNPGLLGEHGFACWINTGTHRVLFDTGQGMTLMHNAARLGIDLSEADAVVLSHGHFDHVGGLSSVLQIAIPASLVMHPRATDPKFKGMHGDEPSRRISVPYMEERAFSSGKRNVVLSDRPTEVVPGVWTTGEIPRTNEHEDNGGPFFLDEDMQRPDPLVDDQAIYIPTEHGLIVVCGCAHAGIANTLDHIAEVRGRVEPIALLIGGLHLQGASEERIEFTVSRLRTRRPERMALCHCTGLAAICRMRSEFLDCCVETVAGTHLEVA